MSKRVIKKRLKRTHSSDVANATLHSLQYVARSKVLNIRYTRMHMKPSAWNLTAELCKHVNAEDERQALYLLGCIPDTQVQYTVRTDETWTRGGAETFVYRFWISVNDEHERGYIIKACVTL